MKTTFVFFDKNNDFIDEYRKVLQHIPDTYFVCETLDSLLQKYPEINAIVSPANSYGMMNGGIDTDINRLLNGVESDVQQSINKYGKSDYSGRKFLPVGQCLILEKNNMLLFVAPTMLMPQKLDSNSINVAMAFNAIYRNVRKFKKDIIIACPCLGTGVGQMSPFISAWQIKNIFEKSSDE